MRGGAKEPLYVPKRIGSLAQIRFTRDYVRSALHEAAHWCLASKARRGKLDYGYVYIPSPRTLNQRCLFESLECRTQAIEALFCGAAGIRFRASADDLQVPLTDLADFEKRIYSTSRRLSVNRLPVRAEQFRTSLAMLNGTVEGG